MTSGRTPRGAGRSSAGALLLMGAGAVALGWVGVQVTQSWLLQRRAAEELERARTTLPCGPAEPAADSLPHATDEVETARIEIPRIELDAMIVGSDDESLRLGVGRIPGTARFGDAGNVGLAAHRDTYFRKLRHVATGDTIHIATARASWNYVVEWTRVVTPDSVEVLDPTPDRNLTLVTCYPFNWVGPAPKRFVVRARSIDQRTMLSLPADTSPASLRTR